MTDLPPCGLYKTKAAIAGVPAGCLVYFHNHGDPGPGVYLPTGWKANRAQFDRRGTTLPTLDDVASLQPVPPEGLYRVVDEMTCCERRCRTFVPDDLVQVGYNREATPILFTPYWGDSGLVIPERGIATDLGRLTRLRPVRVGAAPAEKGLPGGPESFLH